MATTKDTDTASKEVVELGFNDGIVGNEELYAVTSYDEALALLGLDALSTEEAAKLLEWDTNPYQPVDKSELANLPLLIVQWRFVQGDFGGFVVCHAVARLGNGSDWLVLFTDGSTGIYRQLDELTNNRIANDHPRPQMGALVRGGLVPSDYEFEGPDGKMVPARTWYLSNNPPKKAA